MTSSASPGNTGRPAVTRRLPGTQGQRLPLLPAVQPWRRHSPNPDQSSGFYVFRSTHTQGASFNFPGRPVATINDTAGAGTALLDKQLLTVDNHPGSPYADRVYVTWTTFAADGTGYIYEAYSRDYGEIVLGAGPGQQRQRPVRQHVRPAHPAGRLQRESGLSAVRRSRRHPLRRLQQLQQRRDRNRQPQPGAARPVDATAAPASARRSRSPTTTNFPTATPTKASAPTRSGLRPREGSEPQLDLPRQQLPHRRRRPDRPQPGRRHLRLVHQPRLQRARGCTPGRVLGRRRHQHLRGVKTGGCNNDIVYSVSGDRGGSFSGTVIDPRQLPVVTDGNRADDHRPVLARAAFARAAPSSPATTTGPTATTTPPATRDITVSASHDRAASPTAE